jgi:hypothetical protein
MQQQQLLLLQSIAFNLSSLHRRSDCSLLLLDAFDLEQCFFASIIMHFCLHTCTRWKHIKIEQALPFELIVIVKGKTSQSLYLSSQSIFLPSCFSFSTVLHTLPSIPLFCSFDEPITCRSTVDQFVFNHKLNQHSSILRSFCWSWQCSLGLTVFSWVFVFAPYYQDNLVG